jgi:hypothetical protein
VEAFSIYGLGRLAEAWATRPPHPNWKPYAAELARYAADMILEHSLTAGAVREDGSGIVRRRPLECLLMLGEAAQAKVPDLVDAYRLQPDLRDDLVALNRWPERAGLPFGQYVAAWTASCSALGTPGKLPLLLAKRFS